MTRCAILVSRHDQHGCADFAPGGAAGIAVVTTVLSLFLGLAVPPFGVGAESPAASRWAILVAGISGDPDLQKLYFDELRQLRDTLVGPLGFPKSNVFVLVDEPGKAPQLGALTSNQDALRRLSGELAAKVGPGDLVFVFFEGHGNFDGKTYKLSLVGPDPTAAELATILYAIPAARFVVFNATSCSGASIAALTGRGRIVAASTKSGNEKNLTRTGKHFVEAFTDAASDGDKNGRISILEAFNYARRKTEQYYTSQGNLQTEHPVLDDDGDAEAHDKPGPENGDGLLAAMTYLDAGAPAALRGSMTAEESALSREAGEIEKQIEALKYSKATMPPEAYEKTLESLLLRLAGINQKLRGKERKQ